MSHFYVLSFFKKGETIQGGILIKEIRYFSYCGNWPIAVQFHITRSRRNVDGAVQGDLVWKLTNLAETEF